jgi:hypothetical protein
MKYRKRAFELPDDKRTNFCLAEILMSSAAGMLVANTGELASLVVLEQSFGKLHVHTHA